MVFPSVNTFLSLSAKGFRNDMPLKVTRVSALLYTLSVMLHRNGRKVAKPSESKTLGVTGAEGTKHSGMAGK